MSERPPIQKEQQPESESERLERRNALALELFESREVFPFPGISPESYARLKEDEERVFSEYVTPLDELLEKFKKEGMRVEKGRVWKEVEDYIRSVAPASSDGGDYGEDLLHVQNLQITPNMDPRLAELIKLSRV